MWSHAEPLGSEEDRGALDGPSVALVVDLSGHDLVTGGWRPLASPETGA